MLRISWCVIADSIAVAAQGFAAAVACSRPYVPVNQPFLLMLGKCCVAWTGITDASIELYACYVLIDR